MEFTIDDGARLVRSLTDKVMSVMGKIMTQPETSGALRRAVEDETIDKIQTSGLTNHQICHSKRNNKYKQQNFMQTFDTVTDSVNTLVKHKDKLSSVNILPGENLENFLRNPTNDASSTSASTTYRPKDRMGAAIEKSTNISDNNTKHIGGVTIRKPDHLQKVTESRVNFDDGKREKFEDMGEQSHTDTSQHSKQDRLTKLLLNIARRDNSVDTQRSEFYTRETSNKINPTTQSMPFHRQEQFDDPLKEFERDIEFLTSCNNKTSTPIKDTHLTRISVPGYGRKSSDTDEHIRSSPLHRCENSQKATKSPRKSLSFSPYRSRKHVHPISPLARSERTTASSSPSRQADPYTENVLSDAGLDQPGLVIRTDTRKSFDKFLLNSRHNTKPTIDTDPSNTHSTLKSFPKSSTGARRSLFSESSTLSRFLPLNALHSGKPLGFEAYQQFMNVSKTDVLPKYFFENEDEEAVYYLKVKYLDEKDT